MEVRKIFFKLLVCLSILICTFPCEAAKKTVAIMPLECASNINKGSVADVMTEQLLIAVKESGIYSVVERNQLDSVMKEQGFQTLAADPEYSVELGKLLGAKFVLIGKVTMLNTVEAGKKTALQKIIGLFEDPFKSTISIDVKIIDSKTGEISLAKTVSADGRGKDETESLHKACANAAKQFMQEIQAANPFFGRVIGVSGNDIYIDQGIDSGVHKGDSLVVAREGEVMTDAGGQILGTTQTVIGKAKVTEVTAEYSICRITGNGVTAQKGDIVKRDN